MTLAGGWSKRPRGFLSDSIRITVSVDPARASGVAEELRRAGLSIDEVLDDIGAITATCSESQLPAIASVPGVLSVERERTVKVAPPKSPVQ